MTSAGEGRTEERTARRELAFNYKTYKYFTAHK